MERFLIVGLGNPDREYANTRHNVGFMCVDEVARAHELTFARVQSQALVTDGVIAGQRVLLAKPQTFMNRSGLSVAGLVRFYQIPLERLMVVFDDLDLPLGVVRLRKRRRRGRAQGNARHHPAAGQQRLSAPAHRHRTPAGPHGSRGLRPAPV
ncbi:MAG: aminoacyl-tRNA hydrolase [Anaerolineae bacterium]|nr:aminoacyl-tRNA hydrolase [Anaerolineae bacterium]